MAEMLSREEAIFHAALEIETADQRSAYLDTACGNETGLRQRVEALLRRCAEPEGPLDRPRFRLEAAADCEAAQLTEGPGTVIGPYKLLEQIGEGGFGVVFMAEQTQPVRRRVALKVLKPGMDTRQVVARFEAERQALALMDHPNIAHVFDGGATATGRPYFVMELVRGIPITEFCDQNHLPVRERLGLFADVCQAVQHAHQKGIIHRDLKPTNILVTLHDDKAVVKVIDFGIAKATGQQLTDKTLFTNFAQLIGTPLYMSPEQAQLSGLDIDTRTDIYALGVLLYELLTGTTPFDGERLRTAGYDEMRRIIREEEPPRPSTRISTLGRAAATISAGRRTDPQGLRRQCRKELDWIVMKCLEKDRNRRYETSASLAADVRRFLDDEPVQACPSSAWYRFRKLARRNRRALVTAAALALAALVGVGALAVSTVLVWQANQGLKGAVDRERRETYFQRITVAHHELSIDNLAAALRALRECPEDLRQWEWYYLMRLCRVEPSVLPDTTEVNCVAFSPDGRLLASAGGDGAIKIWNCRTGEVMQTFDAHTDSVVSVTFHPDGKHLAYVGADRQLKVWDRTTRQEVVIGPCDAVRKFGTAHAVAFSPDGRQLAAGSDGVVSVWDWKSGQLLHTFPGHDHDTISVAFSHDGRRLATGSYREGPMLWDPTTGGQPLRCFPGHTNPISALAFSPDGARLASASFDRSVRLWDTTTGELRHTLVHTGNVECITFSPDGRRLASAGEYKTVRVWDTETGREVLSLRGHTAQCGCVAFSPDGQRLASASKDGTIRIWDATPLRGDEGQETLTFTEHHEEIRSAMFSPDGRWIASAGMGTDVKVWDAATGRVSVAFNGNTVVVFGLAWQPPDGQRIASAGHGRQATVKVWDVRNRREAFALPAGPEHFTVAFSPDGRYLVTGRVNGAVQVWDAETGQEVGTLGTHGREVRGVVFSRDGRHLASVSGDGIMKLWDATHLDKKQEARRLPLRARVPGPSVNVAFSPDGRRLAIGGEKNTVKIWDVQTGRELHPPLEGHSGEVYTVAFSPDDAGRWIASAGEDSTVKVWDSHTGKLLRSFRGHTGLVTCVAFSPDGLRLVSGSRDTTVKVWDLTLLSEVPKR
jgi:WD40 repeat protein/serine/threonine protein kinase